MRISISTNIAQAQAQFAQVQKQVKFAAARALTQTAVEVQKAVPETLQRSLDRPTPFTRNNSTFIKAATPTSMEAFVLFKDRQSRYMRWQVEGGTYRPSDAGIRLPGNIQVNTFGNIPKGLIAKLKQAAQNGQLSAAIARRLNVNGQRRKGQRGRPLQLFFGVPTGKGWENAPLAIWRRVDGSAGGPGKLIPVIVFEKKPVRYTPRVNLEAMAQPILRQRFAINFDKALQEALATAK